MYDIMDKASWIQNIKVRLGYPVINLAITDEMIANQIDMAIKRVVPYLNAVDVFEVGVSPYTFTDRIPFTVFRVSSSKPAYDSVDLDASIYRSYYIYNNTRFGTANLASMVCWNMYSDVLDDLNPLGFRLIGNVLYIDNGEPPWTVEAITSKSFEKMSEDYVNWCFDYSLALVKMIEGEIRSKVQIEGSPISTNGSDLKSEGSSEKEALEEKLGSTMGLYFATR